MVCTGWRFEFWIFPLLYTYCVWVYLLDYLTKKKKRRCRSTFFFLSCHWYEVFIVVYHLTNSFEKYAHTKLVLLLSSQPRLTYVEKLVRHRRWFIPFRLKFLHTKSQGSNLLTICLISSNPFPFEPIHCWFKYSTCWYFSVVYLSSRSKGNPAKVLFSYL